MSTLEIVYTPATNGTFLNGITRQRVIDILRADGVPVIEKTMSYTDFERADEIFSTATCPRWRRPPASTTAPSSRARSIAGAL
jgi:branched-subunit amino acid aminotransferase/4-amino-4-deoxychorismate lyase